MSKVKSHLKALKDYAEAHNLRLTPPRVRTLEVIAASKKPMTAYDVLDALSKHLQKPQPPTAYRALEFLQKHGFIHRIESLNSYIACCENHKHHGSQFMVCNSCGAAEEIHLCSIPKTLQEQTDKNRFTPSHWNVEIHGKCGKCG